MDIGSIGLRSSVSQEQVTNHQFVGFTKDGKKIVRETSEDGVVSVKIDPEGEKRMPRGRKGCARSCKRYTQEQN